MTEKIEPPSYWIRVQKDKTHYHYTCSKCKHTNRYHKFTFCPYCGKRMETDFVLNENGDLV